MALTTPPVRPARLAWRFLLPAVAAVLGTLVTAVPWLVVTLDRDQIATVVGRLSGDAREAGHTLPWERGPTLDAACTALGERLGARVTVIAPNGDVLGESSQPSAGLPNHADRPEVRAAFDHDSGHVVRWSATLDQRLLYAAWRQQRGDATRAIRIAVPVSSVTEHMVRLGTPIATGLVIAMGLGVGVAWFLSGAMVRRIQRLVTFATALSSGTTTPPLGPERNDELGVLERQLADMARGVSATLLAMHVERERLEAILRGMVEGVIVDRSRRGGRAHECAGPGAARTGVDRPGAADRWSSSCVIQACATRARARGRTPARDVAGSRARGRAWRMLQVNAARLRASDDRPFGFVLVLHDVTELRRLEVVRRDFVANVSHELRTPFTAIKGYAETLLGGGGRRSRDGPSIPRRDRPALGASRPSDRRSADALRPGARARGVAARARLGGRRDRRRVQILGEAARRKGVRHRGRDRRRRAARSRRRRSPAPGPDQPGGQRRSSIRLRAVVWSCIVCSGVGAQQGMVEIRVDDTGVGIPAEDLPRLTERFFRVDKARSRELGGTGLGLAIVKHIVQGHGGRLAIDSELGRGTTVRVTLPIAPHDTATSAS